MQGLLARLTAPCQVVTEKVSESLEHPLPLGERLRVKMHLLFCKFCRRYEKQLLALQQILEKSSPPVEEKLPEDSRERIKRALREKAGDL
ncbi:MAG: hypothetical protein Kow0042_26750 [Calditrichia bacterium]